MKLEHRENEHKASGTTLQVKEDQTLEALLMHHMQGRSKSSLKKLLQSEMISVEGEIVKKLEFPLKAGQKVFVGKKPDFQLPEGLRIIWEDAWLIIVLKDSGLLTIGHRRENKLTAEEYLNQYMQHKKLGERIYVVHRIDRDTSGILVFAKTVKAKDILHTNWHDIVESRRYIAVVEGRPRRSQGCIDTWMDEDPKTLDMFVCPPGQGRRAITHYKVLKTNGRHSLIALELDTGRRNQIRVHMQHIGHPIAGDPRYHSRTNPCNRLCLHAQQIKFRHPITHEMMDFSSEIPADFLKIFR